MGRCGKGGPCVGVPARALRDGGPAFPRCLRPLGPWVNRGGSGLPALVCPLKLRGRLAPFSDFWARPQEEARPWLCECAWPRVGAGLCWKEGVCTLGPPCADQMPARILGWRRSVRGLLGTAGPLGPRHILSVLQVLPSEESSDSTPDSLALGLRGFPHTQASEPEAKGFQHEVSPTLWTMMQRMEEMERCQEAVRQRFSQMVYADPDFDLGTKRGRSDRKGPAVNERPRPPHPIQLTKRAASWEPAATVLLEKPLDEKYFDESMDMEERGEKKAPLRPVPPTLPQQPEGSTLLSVPRETLRSLGDYQDSYQQYLRTISHESVGSFNPWIIVESLAEELVEEALEDVAAELQDVCEDYAEAVFTSEFLEPSK
ncbi:protein moonraker-like isoform X2 [Gracilinanus agilis]|uniref:protein moonraker-like isoform X2 n=1 Tax=Gracilinanus agilis TaxID=191870 RepID=UPI001CFED11C|nr:protein moonraker-like isoform X2 [Gracilinanus agilis]